jgi:uncharacterized membrane protein
MKLGVTSAPLPTHIDETVQAIEKLRSEHREAATTLQRTVNFVIDFLGRPPAAVTLAAGLLAWIALNLIAAETGRRALDPPPFAWLSIFVSVAALLMAVLILGAQRHATQLAARRDHLTLQLALVSEQKTAKIIALLEEMRRDNPQIANRVDVAAAAMSKPSDPSAALDAFTEAGNAGKA